MLRLLLVAAFILAGVVSALNLHYLLTRPPENPLKYTVPQAVLTIGPLTEGTLLIITQGVKCNRSDEAITIRGQPSYYVRVDAHGVVSNPNGQGGTLTIAAHECLDRMFSRPLPALAAGTWRLQGFDCVLPEERHCRSWFSETFEVNGEHE